MKGDQQSCGTRIRISIFFCFLVIILSLSSVSETSFSRRICHPAISHRCSQASGSAPVLRQPASCCGFRLSFCESFIQLNVCLIVYIYDMTDTDLSQYFPESIFGKTEKEYPSRAEAAYYCALSCFSVLPYGAASSAAMGYGS